MSAINAIDVLDPIVVRLMRLQDLRRFVERLMRLPGLRLLRLMS